MSRKYSKEIYSKNVLLKAAYAFTDIAYFHIDTTESEYVIEIKSKGKEIDLYDRFENELIMQQVRLTVSKETKNIREMIIARALASTLTNEVESDIEEIVENTDNNMFEDWFQSHE